MIDPKTIEELRALGPDWDSYGGVRITEAALATVRALNIVPRSNGGLAIIMEAGGATVDIDIEPDGTVDVDSAEVKRA